MKLDDAICKYVKWKFLKHRRAAENYGSYLRKFSWWIKENTDKTRIQEIDELDTGLFQNWMESRDYAQTTICYFMVAVRDLIKYFYLKKVTDLNFMLVQIPPAIPRIQRIATGPDQVAQMCRLLGGALIGDLRDKLILNFLFSSGVRVSELTGLNIKQVDVNRQSISIPNKKHPGGYRVICWDNETHRLLMLWLEKRQFIAQDEALFIGLKGQFKRLTPRSIQRIVKKHAIRAGIENADRVTPHTFRHGFCQNGAKCEIRMDQLQQFMGHLHIESTKKYLQWQDVELEKCYKDKFNRGDKGISIVDICSSCDTIPTRRSLT